MPQYGGLFQYQYIDGDSADGEYLKFMNVKLLVEFDDVFVAGKEISWLSMNPQTGALYIPNDEDEDVVDFIVATVAPKPET